MISKANFQVLIIKWHKSCHVWDRSETPKVKNLKGYGGYWLLINEGGDKCKVVGMDIQMFINKSSKKPKNVQFALVLIKL